ncbi:MAG: tol-pal system YbgF family protein [Pirellulales bacterium]
MDANLRRVRLVIAVTVLTWFSGGDHSPGRSVWAHGGATTTPSAARAAPVARAAPAARAAPEADTEWWKENRKRAVFVPGKGYTLEGVPGYFDEQGRPIGGPIRQATFDAASSQRIEVTLPDEALRTSSEKKPGITERLLGLVGRRHDPQKARKLFDEAEDLFRRREFAAAARKYKGAVQQSPDMPIEEDAMFMLGESYFFADQYPKAVDAYDTLLKKYPGTRRLDDVVVR